MAALTFKKATKEQARLRLALFGPSGSGKTFTALRLATGMGGSIAVIDTERGSASKYADRFAFDVLELPAFTIEVYCDAIRAAAGYNVLIIDSLTHGWRELLAEVDKLANAKYRGNTHSAWSEGTPKQKQLVDAILQFDGHIIATMRTRTEWTVTKDDRGRSTPQRVCLAPEQGKGIEYEFDLLMELSPEHVACVIKDRTGKFQDKLIDKPGEDFGAELAAWLKDGVPPREPKPTPQPQAEPSTTAMAPQQAEPSKPKPVRPYEPETVRQGVQAIAADGAKVKADEGYRGLCVGVIDGLFANDDKNMRAAKRHTLSTYLLGKGSSKEWTAGEVVALLKWACNGGDASNVNENAPIEAERIVRQYEAEHGQQALGV